MASQLLASRARDGSFEVRYQQPFEDFRVSQEQLAELAAHSRMLEELKETQVHDGA